MADTDFQIKGTALTVIVLQVSHYDPQTFPQLLSAKIEQAPDFFNQAAVLIDLSKLDLDSQTPAVAQLAQQVRDAGMQPVAFKGVAAPLADTIRQTGLASLPASQQATSDLTLPKTAVEPTVEVRTIIEEKLVQRPNKVITRPVRSGQQVYAEGGDLICLAAVNEGAEVLADGNIHVYGPLRGRALAGVKGDQNARIFCQQIDAELVSVAGCFALSENIDDSLHRKAAQVHLADDTLRIEAL